MRLRNRFALVAVTLVAAASGLMVSSPAFAAGFTKMRAPAAGSINYDMGIRFGTGRCLDDPSGSVAGGTQLDQQTCFNTPNSIWTLDLLDDNFGFKLDNEGAWLAHGTSECAALWGGVFADGTKIADAACIDSTDEDFAFWTDGTHVYLGMDTPFWTGYAVSVVSSSTANGAKIQMWHSGASSSQFVCRYFAVGNVDCT
jgi:hypothetical protein